MVSDHFRRIEDEAASCYLLHDDLVGEIARKLNTERATVARMLYHTSIASTLRVLDVAHIANEFLTAIHAEQIKERTTSGDKAENT